MISAGDSAVQPAPTPETPRNSTDLLSEHGTCYVLFAYDVGLAINLDEA
jgi:hypothetical protein